MSKQVYLGWNRMFKTGPPPQRTLKSPSKTLSGCPQGITIADHGPSLCPTPSNRLRDTTNVEIQTPCSHFTANITKTQRCKSLTSAHTAGHSRIRIHTTPAQHRHTSAVPLCTAVVSGPASQWPSMCFSSQAFPCGLQPGQIIHGGGDTKEDSDSGR